MKGNWKRADSDLESFWLWNIFSMFKKKAARDVPRKWNCEKSDGSGKPGCDESGEKRLKSRVHGIRR